MAQPLQKTLRSILKNLNIELTFDPAIHFRVHAQTIWKQRFTDICTPYHSNTIHNSQKVEVTQCPWTEEWVTKCGVYTIQPKELRKFWCRLQHGWNLKSLR